MFEEINGHKKQIEFLSKAFANGKLAHAYIFAGPEGVGKKLVARNIANKLLESKSDFHPDFLEIEGGRGIKIEQIRELNYKLSLKPYQAKNKVALIDKAQEMTIEAANALLKILEEPKNYTYIFLITNNPNRLPKTILSRCQKINFGLLARQEIDLQEETEYFFKIFISDNLSEKLLAGYEMANLETEEIKKTLDIWSMKLETKLLQNPGTKLAQKIKMILEARRYLDQNVNSKLLLTNLMLST